MHNYFKPLRRKLGVATLIVACVLAGSWVRSSSFIDFFLVPTERSPGDILASWDSSIVWLREDWNNRLPWFSSRPQEWPWVSCTIDGRHAHLFQSTYIRWKWRWCGFALGLKGGRPTRTVVVIPYWSIVIPLTSLSAWLLRSKLRAENVPEKQG